jgi:hypothetical protein
MMASADGSGLGVVVWPHARSLMRLMRPVVWVVLQDIVLDAEWRNDRLVASTSARLVAEHLHLDPSTTASAMKTLRARGVVELEQASETNGRFGLAAYTLHLPDCIDVWSPRRQTPDTENPRAVTTPAGSGVVLSCPWDGLDLSPRADSSHTEENSSSLPYESESSSIDPTAGRRVPSPSYCASGTRYAVEAAHASEPAQRRAVRRRHSPTPVPAEQGAFDLETGDQ